MKTLSIILTIILFCSFKQEYLCLDELLLNINRNISVKKLYKDLSKNERFKIRTHKQTFKRNKSFEGICTIKSILFKNSDSTTIYATETIGGDINNPTISVKIKLIALTIYFPDSTTLKSNYNYIVETLCKTIPFESETPLYDKEKKVIGMGRNSLINKSSRPSLDIAASFSKTERPTLYIMYSDNR